ncbi:hypothetical protein A4G99_06150 [Haladaptatus sp. R4]|uniref:GrpB family protein n=1 Tax=Haladaptatus sp. R4 TaxID=1679489 RepID=UPI0007B491C8|nr:GrpB family protein [Haladaptatus sp. R4]KZN24049.1 hypothetical protein A4G99_06150 [Haladaptatus sp. R4]
MEDIRIEIVEYDPEWPVHFEREATRMEEILGEHVVSIEHIGSTSVPGLPAKPIVDICPVVSDMDEGRTCAELLQEAGYSPGEQDRPDDWISLGRNHDEGQQFNVHIRPRYSDAVTRYLLLREYLRDHPEAREEYGEVKRKAAENHSTDITEYTRAKSDIIQSILECARNEGYDPKIE